MENIIAFGLIVLFIVTTSVLIYVHKKDKKAKRVYLANKRTQLFQCSVAGEQILAAKTLDDLFKVYQNMVKYLFDYVVRCPSINADQYGVFRSHGNPYNGELNEGLKTITKNEIYLGNIYGLWTKRLSDWERSDDEDAKKKVFDQFKHLLYSGYRFIEDEIKKDLRKVA